MVELLDTYIHTVGPLAWLVLFGAAMIEYVFPPFPGDTVVLLGGIYAVRGEQPWALVLLAVTAGSVCGATVDYVVGRKLSHRFAGRPALAKVQARMRHGGIVLIAFNRFMPGIRGLLFVAAGAARLDPLKVLGWGTVSALLWNALILGVGVAVGGNAERLEALFRQYNRAAWAAVVLVVVVVLARRALAARRGEEA